MHPRNIARRNEVARASIKASADALADALGLPPLGEVSAVEWRTAGVGPMRELEEIARLLDSAARAIGQGATHGNQG